FEFIKLLVEPVNYSLSKGLDKLIYMVGGLVSLEKSVYNFVYIWMEKRVAYQLEKK
ncbi:hypothetical protein ACH5RR_018485, partial [Cinchona calisaya]